MTKYFTKYLPVEGEIEEGDVIMQKSDSNIMKCRKRQLTGLECSGYDGFHSTELFTKVKLFLCSRDIQVGDKIFCESTQRFGVASTIIKDNQNTISYLSIKYKPEQKTGWAIFPDEAFKVIGEISLDALSYVKEGDEFTDGQIKLDIRQKRECLCEVKGQYRSQAQQSCKYMEDDYRGGDFCTRKSDFVYQVQIKGPCGHFH